MGISGRAPGWVYRRDARRQTAIRESYHDEQRRRTSEKIEELEKKNRQLQLRNEELELRNEELEKELELLRKK